MASVQVKILSASLSGISSPNSSSNAITTSTVSKLSRPKSLTKWELSFTCEVQTKQQGQYNIYRRFGSTNDTHRLVVWIECFPLDVGFRWNRPPYGRQQSGRIRPNSAAFVAASILPDPSRSVPSSTPLFHGVRAKLSVLPQANARAIEWRWKRPLLSEARPVLLEGNSRQRISRGFLFRGSLSSRFVHAPWTDRPSGSSSRRRGHVQRPVACRGTSRLLRPRSRVRLRSSTPVPPAASRERARTLGGWQTHAPSPSRSGSCAARRGRCT